MSMGDQLVDSTMYDEVKDFYREETRLLDGHRYEEWLDMLTEDVRYQVPLRETREEPDKEIQGNFYHVNDDKFQLELRVERLETEFAWSEDPPTRTRHLLFNTNACELGSIFIWINGLSNEPDASHRLDLLMASSPIMAESTPGTWR